MMATSFMRRMAIRTVVTALWVLPGTAAPLVELAAATVTTSFESPETAPITVGPSPISLTISAGQALTLGQKDKYHSGNFALHIRPGETSTGTFETDASAVSFWVLSAGPGATGTIRVFDENNAELLSGTPTGIYVQHSVVRAPGETLIRSFEIANTGTEDIVVDDLSFTAEVVVPPPPFDPDDPIPAGIATGSVDIVLTEIASGLAAPVYGTAAPGDTERLFIVDQSGPIVAIDLATEAQSIFLDLSGLLVPLGAFGPGTYDERGLLGLAFHPDYATNGLL